MTEPPPGAGSDPSMLKTEARPDGDDYLVNGHKWFSTGAEGAMLAIVMADVPGAGATMFLADMATPGITIERSLQTIGEHEGIGFMLADHEMDLHGARLAIWHAAWVLDQGELGLHESSRTKVMVSESLWRVIDRCVQILGGQGVTGETVVARIFADMRALRIYDGPSEVHRWSLAKRILMGARRSERP